jgi:hypothetical protein
VLQDRTAGDPMRQEVRWTDLTFEQIAGHLAEAGTPVSVPVVKQLLRKHGYARRKAQKSKAMGGHADRNQQFENFARLKQEYLSSDDPILSMDTKKKELVGNFYRARRLLTRGVIETFDHDFASFAFGVIIPHVVPANRARPSVLSCPTPRSSLTTCLSPVSVVSTSPGLPRGVQPVSPARVGSRVLHEAQPR